MIKEFAMSFDELKEKYKVDHLPVGMWIREEKLDL